MNFKYHENYPLQKFLLYIVTLTFQRSLAFAECSTGGLTMGRGRDGEREEEEEGREGERERGKERGRGGILFKSECLYIKELYIERDIIYVHWFAPAHRCTRR